MIMRFLGGELHLEVFVLGRTAAEVLGRWSFVITTSPMSHSAMYRMTIDRTHHEKALGEDGMSVACLVLELAPAPVVPVHKVVHVSMWVSACRLSPRSHCTCMTCHTFLDFYRHALSMSSCLVPIGGVLVTGCGGQ